MSTAQMSVLCAIALVFTTAEVRADGEVSQASSQLARPGSEDARADDDDGVHPALSTSAAVVPGLLWHGLGTRLAGDRKAGNRLLAVEGIGLGLIVAGGLPLGLSGASRKVAWPTIPLVVSGAGLFITSWLADIYGAAGGGSLDGQPFAAPEGSASLGYAWIRDPQFDYQHFAVVEGEWRTGPLRITPSAWIATDDDNQRWRLEVGQRLLGRRDVDGDFLDVVYGVVAHRFGDERFNTYTGDIQLAGRFELGRLGAALDGAFIDVSTGLGLELLHFRAGPGSDLDLFALLLGEFAAGMWLGEQGGTQFEMTLGYNHRRDNFAAGLAGATQGSGFAGQFGATLRARGSRGWDVVSEVWAGSAQVYRLSMGWRF